MMQKTRVAIGLGASLGDKRATLDRAIEILKEDLLKNAQVSTFHESLPWGGVAKNTFLNAVMVGDTDWKPPAIVSYLKEVERDLGRKAADRYADREVDLDLLIYGDQQWKGDGVIVPHPEMHRRSFVLAPLAELWPLWVHPQYKRTVSELLVDNSPSV